MIKTVNLKDQKLNGFELTCHFAAHGPALKTDQVKSVFDYTKNKYEGELKFMKDADVPLVKNVKGLWVFEEESNLTTSLTLFKTLL